jgi:two-component system, NarL family, response regulator DevR
MTHSVVLVDDHEVVRSGLRRSLEQVPDCTVVGEAGTVAEALAVIDLTCPDVAILDVVLPDGDGIQLCREVLARHPDVACVLLTSFPGSHGMLTAALAGAAAYLGKDSSSVDLAATISAAARGERQLDEAGLMAALDELTTSAPGGLEQLTPQERRVFELIGQGLSNRQIAEHLHLAERTVKNYSSRVLSKLVMTRRSEAAALAARLAERRAQREARAGVTTPPGPN